LKSYDRRILPSTVPLKALHLFHTGGVVRCSLPGAFVMICAMTYVKELISPTSIEEDLVVVSSGFSLRNWSSERSLRIERRK
jgi:hypothetical protein